MNLSPDLRERVLAAAKREAPPTRSEARSSVAIVIVTAVVLAGAIFLWLGGVRLGDPARGVASRPVAFVCGTVIGWSIIAVVATWIAFTRGTSMLGRQRGWLLGIAVLTPMVLFAWMLVWNTQYPETMTSHVGSPGLKCLAFTLAMTAWPLVALLYLRRERNPLYPGAAGAARGVAMGALAGILVDLWCPISGPGHVLLGHITPMLILMALGALAGRVLTGVRSR